MQKFYFTQVRFYKTWLDQENLGNTNVSLMYDNSDDSISFPVLSSITTSSVSAF